MHLEGEVHGDLFDGLIEGSVTGEVDIGHVYAESTFACGLVQGPDGKYRTELGLQGKIGADLVTATATGSASIAGIGVTGSATFKVGIGAQLDLGYHDGKFNFHFGAALGIGFEFGFSIDIGGAVEAVGGFLNNVGNAVGGFFNDVGNAIGDFFSGW